MSWFSTPKTPKLYPVSESQHINITLIELLDKREHLGSTTYHIRLTSGKWVQVSEFDFGNIKALLGAYK